MKGKTKAVFTELVLSESSSKMLRKKMEELTGGLLPNVKSHHITLKFKPSPEEVKSLPGGEQVFGAVTGFVSDHRVQAFVCDWPIWAIGDELECSNKHPHVTVATGMDGDKMISPRVSNDVLAEGITPIPEMLLFEARIGFSDGKEDHFTLDGSVYQE